MSWSPCDGRGRLSPHRGWKASTFLKIPRWADRLTTFEPAIPLGLAPRPSQRGHDDYQADEVDRGRHPGFARHERLAGGPGSLSLSFGLKVRDRMAIPTAFLDATA